MELDNIWDGIEMRMREEWGLIKLEMQIELEDLPFSFFLFFFQSVRVGSGESQKPTGEFHRTPKGQGPIILPSCIMCMGINPYRWLLFQNGWVVFFRWGLKL